MLIDKSFFVGELNIPNTSLTHVGEVLESMIERYEPEILSFVLGKPLYDSFKTGIEAATPEQKWTDLKSGVDYTYQQRDKKWIGIVDTRIDIMPRSFVANYVYYYFMRNNYTQTTAMGEVTTLNENSIPVNPGLKMMNAWNEIRPWVMSLQDYLNAHKEDYSGWEKVDQFYVLNQLRPINTFNI